MANSLRAPRTGVLRDFPGFVEERSDGSWRDTVERPPYAHKLRVESFAISIDGYGAGPGQDLENPLGIGGPDLMEWLFRTHLWQRMHGQDGGESGVDSRMAGGTGFPFVTEGIRAGAEAARSMRDRR